MTQSAATRYHAGLEAERAVVRAYLRRGCTFQAHRYRGTAGEIDLIMRDGSSVVFIEVKKSATHDRAVQALSDRQLSRILNTASEFLGTCKDGANTNTRLDLATVDAAGRVEIIENVSGL